MIKNILLIVGIVLLSLSIILFSYLLKDGDFCCNSSICSNFTKMCDIEDVDNEGEKGAVSQKDIELVLYDIKEGDTLSKGTVVKGEITGSWYFEGEFPVRILNGGGDEINTLIAVAKEPWMTEESVTFEFVLDTVVDEDTDIVMRFEKSNPSGLEEFKDWIDMRFVLKKTVKEISLEVYFPNTGMGSPEDCSKVFPVERKVQETVAVGRASLMELLSGVSESEKESGYYTNINDGVVIQSLVISNGIARVDFSSKLEESVGGSCRVTSIRAQISETLKQFPTVDTVIISIDGRTEDILQP